MAWRDVLAGIVGTEPLMMNPMSDAEQEALRQHLKGGSKPRNLTPRDEAERKIIRDPDGRACLRDDHLYGALINAGRDVAYEGRKKITVSTPGVPTRLFSVVKVKDRFIPLFDGQPGVEPAWEVDVRTSRNAKMQAIVQVRPMFQSWRLEFTLRYEDTRIKLDVVRELLEKAGLIGLGSYRGRYGLFEVTKFEEVNGTPSTTRTKGKARTR